MTTIPDHAATEPGLDFDWSAPRIVRTLEEIEAAREAASAEMVRAARREDNRARWHLACPPELQQTDWNDARLAPYSAPIGRILGHSMGKRGLIASGPTGRGKSRAMWSLMWRLGVEEGNSARYWSAHDFFSELGDQIRYGRDDARRWVEAVAVHRVLFIDDYGQEALQTTRAEWAAGWFFRFLDLRVGAGLPLYLTTNLNANQIAGRNGDVRGDPLLRRILDLCEPVSFAGVSQK